MTSIKALYVGITAGIAAILVACAALQSSDAGIGVGENDLGGVVTSASGPEAGVWVIAETTDLPTKYAKIVVTDERGRYVMPELPKASYSVWVRGYGLVDSPKVRTAPGTILNLTAVVAPSAAAAAEYYPAIYWCNGCVGCHQMGNKATRTIPKDFAHFKSSAEAWARRITSGQAMTSMVTQIGRFDTSRALALYADWTDRIAAGELPFAKPERPQGVERNIVITLWDWSRARAYLHDEIATDRRNPTVNANGRIYGAPEYSTDWLPILDPVTHTATEIKVPVRDPKTGPSRDDPMAPSPYWGDERIWDSQTNTHNPMMDTLWFSGSRDVLGWINTKMLDETGDEQKSQGWTAFVVDTNGNGRRDECTEPNQPLDPAKDRRLNVSTYGIGVTPDGTVWTTIRVYPGFLVRTVPGPNPPATALSEIYEVPWDNPREPGYGVRGMDVDRNGVVWTPLSSGHLASFDRRKCKGPLNGLAAATGRHCPEGWTLHPFPGPQFQGVKDTGSVESSYYTWVDQFNTPGLGKDVPMATGNLNDAVLALVGGKFVTLRVPYPMGYYIKGMDGRIDDPRAGWKGRGLWSTTSTRAPFHMEGGKGTLPKVVKFQLRPDPLAR